MSDLPPPPVAPALSVSGVNADMPVIDPPTPVNAEGDPVAAEPAPPAAEPPVKVEGAEPEPAPKPNGIETRFAKMAEQRRAAEAKAAEAQAEAARLAQEVADLRAAKKPDVDPDPRPQRADFDDPDAYEAALIEHSTRRALAEAPIQLAQQQAERAAREAQQAAQTAWHERVAAVKETHPDFDTVVTNPNLPISVTMAQALTAEDNGPAVAYHLGQNPAEAARIAKLAPIQQVQAIARLAVKLEQPPPVSAAPPPIKPLGSRNTADKKPLAEMTMAEYEAARMAANGGRAVR